MAKVTVTRTCRLDQGLPQCEREGDDVGLEVQPGLRFSKAERSALRIQTTVRAGWCGRECGHTGWQDLLQVRRCQVLRLAPALVLSAEGVIAIVDFLEQRVFGGLFSHDLIPRFLEDR